MAKKNIKLVHTSDTHLGGDWHSQLSRDAFKTIVQSVSQVEADALLIVGDVFDHARIEDELLKFFLGQIASINQPVVILPGNHDIYDCNSLYLRTPFLKSPPNFNIVKAFEGEVISFPDLGLDIWGRAMEVHTPEFKPLEGMTRSGNDHWLIALAHGHFHFDDDKDIRSAPIYPHEVEHAVCDYLALGHWDRHVDVSQGDVRAVYSGAPLGAVQTNDTVAFTLVELDPFNGVLTQQVTTPILSE